MIFFQCLELKRLERRLVQIGGKRTRRNGGHWGGLAAHWRRKRDRML